MISGYGAFGDAGRIGSWDDGLVTMKLGDVLRVYPSRGEHSYALWLENGVPATTTWKDYENIQAVAKAQEMIEQATESPETLDIVFGQMPAFTSSAIRSSRKSRCSKAPPVRLFHWANPEGVVHWWKFRLSGSRR